MNDDIKKTSEIPPEQMSLKSRFQFKCHKGVKCFTDCCRGIDIMLTPYDILTMRKKLDLTSEEFLAVFTQPQILEKADMPVVTLKLLDDDRNSCPFVEDKDGCVIYEDRPTTCRYYPLGVGSLSYSGEQGKKDEFGNAIKGDVLVNGTSNAYIYAESRLVAAIGMKDVVIVETKDAILVADKTSAQDVKHIVDKLIDQDRPEKDFHRVVYRPWGNFDSVDEGTRYKVKRITVNPGAKLSLQKHKHRAEHWVVVSGTAKVYRNDEEFILTENESIFIPLGHVHSLENPGDTPLEIIEVQSGSYLGEDDIIRFEDKYGRREPQGN
jgi:mannose-6-phosphate isomerase-like protein (cupin superfamily)/Fe-S-cluster containining protein